jgi:hypothetical protein
LIKVFAERFHIRIEMKQIGARQEAGRIGGIGACGRELCCASWMSSFSSVTTNAARVQDISLNPLKLAGQCSKLKCCLMYEYDVYADARQTLPRVREPLQAIDGEYYLVKTDILGRTMSFSTSKDTMANVVTIPTSRVREILAMNRAGKKVDSIADMNEDSHVEEPTYRTEEDSITRFDNQSKRRRKNRNNNNAPRQKDKKVAAEGDVKSEEEGGNTPARQERGDRQQRRNNRRDKGHVNRSENNTSAQQTENPSGEQREARENGGRQERRDRRQRRGNRYDAANKAEGGNNGATQSVEPKQQE